MNWYVTVLRNYAGFGGRARRKEFWMFALFNIIFTIVAMIIDRIAGTTISGTNYGLFYGLYILATLIPNFAVSIRRIHDIGKSGTLYFVIVIPIIVVSSSIRLFKESVNPAFIGVLSLVMLGFVIWLIVLLCTDGDRGENKWGPSPKSNDQSFGAAGTIDGDIKM